MRSKRKNKKKYRYRSSLATVHPVSLAVEVLAAADEVVADFGEDAVVVEAVSKAKKVRRVNLSAADKEAAVIRNSAAAVGDTAAVGNNATPRSKWTRRVFRNWAPLKKEAFVALNSGGGRNVILTYAFVCLFFFSFFFSMKRF